MQSSNQSMVQFKWPMRLLVGVWLMALLFLSPILDFYPHAYFFSDVFLPIAILLAVFATGVFGFLVWRGIRAILERRLAFFLVAILLLFLGAVAPFSGVMIGRFAAVLILHDRIQDAVEMARVKGQAKTPAGGEKTGMIDASPFAAVYVTDGYVSNVQGVAYDSTGRLGQLLPEKLEARPADWHDKMPEYLQCSGQASHIWGNYWKVSLDLTPCISL